MEGRPEYRSQLVYADGEIFEVDPTEWIHTSAGLFRLKDPVLFNQAKPGLGVWFIDWVEGEIDLGADNLRNLAVEQAGGIGHDRKRSFCPCLVISHSGCQR